MYLSRGITRFSPFSKEKIAPDWVSTSRAGDDLRLETNQSDLNCGTNMTIGARTTTLPANVLPLSASLTSQTRPNVDQERLHRCFGGDTSSDTERVEYR